MLTSKKLEVIGAKHVSGYRVQIDFNNGATREVDFTGPMLRLKGYCAQYSRPEGFRSFRVAGGNIVWGKNWDVVFPITDLLNGNLP